MSWFECLKKLHKEELWDSLCYLGDLVLTMNERRPDTLQPLARYQSTIYYADALYQLERYKKAEQIYMKGLSLRKAIQRSPETRRSTTEFVSEFEVKFRLHLCLVRQEKNQEAVGVLESIPTQFRTAKMEAALGKLYRQMGREGPASQRFQDLLRLCPFALDAIVELMNCGTDKEKVEQILLESTIGNGNIFSCLEWFPTWLAAQDHLANREYGLAAEELVSLDEKSILSNNGLILTDLGRTYYYAGEQQKAVTILQRVHSLDSLTLRGMDILASLLCEEKRMKELESLATRLMLDSPNATEPWIAFGYLCLAQKKHVKALYFSHKAATTGFDIKLHLEGMILKGRVLYESKKWEEAAQHYREALLIDTKRMEVYCGLVAALLKQDKYKEALVCTEMCKKALGQDFPRALSLYAVVLSKNPAKDEKERAISLRKATSALQEAVDRAPYLLNAVTLLAELYTQQDQHERAVSLLRTQADLTVNSRLHRMLGECLSRANRDTEAISSFHFGLSLNPEDRLAAAGLEGCDERLRSREVSPFNTPDAPVTTGFTHLLNAPRRDDRRNPNTDISMDSEF